MWIPLLLVLCPPRSKECQCGQHHSVKCLSVCTSMRTSRFLNRPRAPNAARSHTQVYYSSLFVAYSSGESVQTTQSSMQPNQKASKQPTSHRTVARCRSAARQRVPRRGAQCEQLVCLARPIPAHLNEKRGRRIKARRQLTFKSAGAHLLVAMTMTMTHSEKSVQQLLEAWPYRHERRGHNPAKKSVTLMWLALLARFARTHC